MLGQLNGESAHAARACLDEDFLPFLQLGHLDQRLPRDQTHQRDGGRFLHRESLGLVRQRSLFDRNQLGEAANPEVIGPRIDRIARLELPHARAHPDHHAGHIVPQDQRHAIRQDELEIPIPNLGVQQVHASGMHLHQHFVVAQLRVGHFCRAQCALLPITVENKCFHGDSLCLLIRPLRT
jgi:hypothetical protein